MNKTQDHLLRIFMENYNQTNSRSKLQVQLLNHASAISWKSDKMQDELLCHADEVRNNHKTKLQSNIAVIENAVFFV